MSKNVGSTTGRVHFYGKDDVYIFLSVEVACFLSERSSTGTYPWDSVRISDRSCESETMTVKPAER